MSRRTPESASQANDTASSGVLSFTPGSLTSLSTSVNSTVDIVLKQWSYNPLTWSTNGSSQGCVVSVEVVDSPTGTVVPVRDIAAPVLLTICIDSDDSDSYYAQNQYACGFWNTSRQAWDDRGAYLVSVSVDPQDNTTRLLCAAMHLTDFSAIKAKTEFLHLGVPNPLTDWRRLGAAFSRTSLFTTVVTLAIGCVTLVGWIVLVMLDRGAKEKLMELRRMHVVMFGTIKAGEGLHVPDVNAVEHHKMAMFRQLRVRARVCVLVDVHGYVHVCVCVCVCGMLRVTRVACGVLFSITAGKAYSRASCVRADVLLVQVVASAP